ncbi:MAG TPA: hypothetical protein PKD09_07125 [Aggregatilinea sp.]|uniref:hypothetical protein n=1 Tax=Aggregatilinea sp. TaxID=2806333 RepID=UPI002B698086|nr:hypothetical protein [Aggregatilinea sp.]HML21399.1 hypothetical protein [Aggregatilinea sp.]
MVFQLQEPYAPRPIRLLDPWAYAGWRLKVYGIAYGRALPRPELVEAAQAVAAQRLPQPAVTGDRYGVGFLGVHDGRGAAFVFVDWWQSENELHHHVYVAPTEQPTALEYVTPSGLSACVWDLAVICFERQAWLETVLANPAGPDLDAYLARCLDADV